MKEHSAISSQLQLQETQSENTTTHVQENENTISPLQGGTGNISETLEIDSGSKKVENFASQCTTSKIPCVKPQKISPVTTKYSFQSKKWRLSSRKKIFSEIAVSTEKVTFRDKNISVSCEELHSYTSPLCDSHFVHRLLKFLDEKDQLDDFNKLIVNLCDGRLPFDNIAWKSAA